MAQFDLDPRELLDLDELLGIAQTTLTKGLAFGETDENVVKLLERLHNLQTKLSEAILSARSEENAVGRRTVN